MSHPRADDGYWATVDAWPRDGSTDVFESLAIGAPEVRWFVRGSTRLPHRPPDRTRTDFYHLPTLRPDCSVKRRGPRELTECKLRLLDPGPIVVSGVPGQLEHWCKFMGLVIDAGDGWVEVNKIIWREEGVELAALWALGQEWWSVALQLDPRRAARLPRWLGKRLGAARKVISSSYPSWLITLTARSR